MVLKGGQALMVGPCHSCRAASLGAELSINQTCFGARIHPKLKATSDPVHPIDPIDPIPSTQKSAVETPSPTGPPFSQNPSRESIVHH